MQILAAFILVVALAVGWLAQLLGLAGNWLIVAAVAAYAWLLPSEGRAGIGGATVLALLLLAIVGEIVELAASAWGVQRVGGSRRGAVLAIMGSIAGSIVGLFVGVPVPLVGSLIAAVLFGGLGALAGAVLGEVWTGRDLDSSVEVGKAAFVGRLLGTLAKLIVGTIMVVVTLAALVVH
jgi:uncharacterized protein